MRAPPSPTNSALPGLRLPPRAPVEGRRQRPRPKPRTGLARIALVACGSPAPGGGGGGGGGGKGGGGASAKPAQFPVEVRPVELRRVDYVVRAVGSIEAYERVQITARVAGALDKITFREGQTVEKGAVLAEIDAARFKVSVDAAKASLARAEAALAEAKSGLQRREEVATKSPGLIPSEEIEGHRTRVAVAEAEIQAAKARLAETELNARDATIRAPIAGIIEVRPVQTGQWVQPGTAVTSIVRRDPLLLRFKVPEADAARLQPGLVTAFSAGEKTAHAKITHVASVADQGSRLVGVVGEIDAADAPSLRAGAFADVSVTIPARDEAPVVPEIAIRPSERGFLAYVIEEGRAKSRVLTLGMRTPDGQVEVRAGLRAGESLVVRGAEALREGAEVKIVEGSPPEKPRARPEAEASGTGGGDAARGGSR